MSPVSNSKVHTQNKPYGSCLYGSVILTFEALSMLLSILHIKGPCRALLYSKQNQLVSQDSTVSEPYFAFHSFSIL
jgi:hypothetical protein